jgi:hypothetical protein
MGKMVVHEEGVDEGVGDGEKYFADYVGLIITILWHLVALSQRTLCQNKSF